MSPRVPRWWIPSPPRREFSAGAPEGLGRVSLFYLPGGPDGGCWAMRAGSTFLQPLCPAPAHPSPPQLHPKAPHSQVSLLQAENRLCNGSDKECVSPTSRASRKETLKAQKETYRKEKKRATKQLFSALTDPSVVIMADSLKIRGTLKSWTKLWCVLKPGVLLIYKTPKVGQWVGTVLLHCCELIERPSKKDGFCFKLFHPLDQSVWAVKGPKGESVGSITQPLPSSYLIFRAASESDGESPLPVSWVPAGGGALVRCKPGVGEHGSGLHYPPTRGEGCRAGLWRLQGQAGRPHQWWTGAAPTPTRPGRVSPTTPRPPSLGGTELTPGPLLQLDEEPQVETVLEENKGLIWVLLRQLRPGMDLSRVVLPTFVLEPRSFLSKLSDHYCHADLLSRAAREDNAYGRMKLVLRWYLSGFYKKPKGIKKPYNPVLGEMFRCCWIHPQTRSCTFYIAEQARPPLGRDGFSGQAGGNSMSALLDGKATLTFLDRAEDYTLTMPYAHCRGILYGTMTLELGGSVTIACEKNHLQAELDFKLKPFFGGSTSINQISGKIRSGENVLAHLTGHWDRDVFIQEEGSGSPELFWTPSREVRRQSLKRHTVLFEEQMEMESERLWQHVTRAIHEGDQHRATKEKCVLEEAQRQRIREHQQGLTPWTPQLFHLDPLTHEWHVLWPPSHSPWNPLTDVTQFEQDGVLHTLQRETVAHKTTFLGSPESGREVGIPRARCRCILRCLCGCPHLPQGLLPRPPPTRFPRTAAQWAHRPGPWTPAPPSVGPRVTGSAGAVQSCRSLPIPTQVHTMLGSTLSRSMLQGKAQGSPGTAQAGGGAGVWARLGAGRTGGKAAGPWHRPVLGTPGVLLDASATWRLVHMHHVPSMCRAS
uniref:Oxysterol binding protein like 5 n=1 Tax=Spermophilus dauricus TaxID=99837 RepID=A0A8C9QIL8_SPEDA